MQGNKLYLIVGGILIAVVVIVLMLGDSETENPQTAGNLPPGHPSIDGAQQGSGMPPSQNPADPNAPNKSNVREEFMHVIEKLREKVNQNPKDTAGVLELANMLRDSHKLDEAAGLYERILKVDKKNTSIMLSLSICYFNLGKTDDAMRVTNDILKVEPKNTIALYNIGAMYATNGDKEKAKSAWEDLIKRFPNTDDATRAKESIGKL